jgi:hypothetical protein
MKIFRETLLCVMILLLFRGCEKDRGSGEAKIKDSNFLNALIKAGFDSDGDSLISSKEAEAVNNQAMTEFCQ